MSAIDDALAGLEGAPDAPAIDVCAMLLEYLAGLVEVGGAARFVKRPVAAEDVLPDPWSPTPFGVGVALVRLFDHAGLAFDVRVRDARADEARGHEISLSKRLLVVDVTGGCATFELVGVAATSVSVRQAVGVAVCLALDVGSPYRDARSRMGRDLVRRGMIASAYAGLGAVLARGRILEDAFFLGDEELGFLLAVQAIVRGDASPGGLDPAILAATAAWCVPLVGRADALRAALGIGAPDTWEDTERPSPAPLARRPIVDGAEAPVAVARQHVRKTLAGVVVGGGAAAVVVAALAMPIALGGAIAVGLGAFGGWVGHGVAYARCTGCGAVLAEAATICTACGGAVGRI